MNRIALAEVENPVPVTAVTIFLYKHQHGALRCVSADGSMSVQDHPVVPRRVLKWVDTSRASIDTMDVSPNIN
jgi:hypothetical protein